MGRKTEHHGIGLGGALPLLAFGAACGSLAMYFFDPILGRRRRALLRDQGVRLQHEAREYSVKHAKDLANRARGMMAKAQHLEGKVDDTILVERVRAAFGRSLSHPRAVKVSSEQGVVTLSGLILAEELDGVLASVEKVAGVRQVVNRLEPHDEPGNIPSLQGERPGYLH
jgi:hypothetical protein